MKIFHFATLGECNENCLFCVKRGSSPVFLKSFTTQEIKKILARKRKECFEGVRFDGGEPTMRKDLAQLISFCKKIKYHSVTVITNGTLLANEKLVKKFLNIKSTKNFNLGFVISLHSHIKNVSEKLTQTPNTFAKTINGLENLTKYGCQNIKIYHLINEYNYKSLPDFVNFINKKFPTIKFILFSFVYPAGAVLLNKDIIPKLSLVRPYLLKSLKLCKKYQINFDFPSCGMIPFCLFLGYEKYFISRQEKDRPQNRWIIDSSQNTGYNLASKDFHQKTKIKIPECSDCVFYEICPGLWKTYAELHGTKELKPIHHSRPQDKRIKT